MGGLDPGAQIELILIFASPFIIMYLGFAIFRGLIRNVFYLRPPPEEVEQKIKNNKAWSRLLVLALIIGLLYKHFAN